MSRPPGSDRRPGQSGPSHAVPLTSRLHELLADAGPGIKVTPTTHGGRTIVSANADAQFEAASGTAPAGAGPAHPTPIQPIQPAPPAARPGDAQPVGYRSPAGHPSETSRRLQERLRQPLHGARPAARPVGAPRALPASSHTSSSGADACRPPSPAPGAALPHMPRATVDKLDAFAATRQPAAADQPTSAGTGASARSQRRVAADAPAAQSDLQPVAKSNSQQTATAAAAVPSQPAAHKPIKAGGSEIRAAIMASKPAFVGIGVFSLVINLLMLTGPLFMLQVYDRVIPSGSIPTLLGLSALTAALYAMIGFFELVRTRVIARVGVEIDQRLADRILKASLRRSLIKQGASLSAMRELDTVRQFVSGPAPMTFFDAPWTPLYLLVIFMVHWMLGTAALIGAALIILLTLASERGAREPLTEANKAAARSMEMTDSAQRNAEALAAMGMVEAYRRRWQAVNADALNWQILASDRIGSTTAVSKAVRLLLQSLMLAVGAALAVSGQISAGAIIAGTIIFGRALAPVEQAVGQWRSFIKARESYARLEQLLAEQPEPPPRTALPAPRGHLEVSQLRVAAPDTRKLILANLNFHVRPGELLAVVGPSASGKSTLARTLVGLWPPFSGTVRIDGADINQWSPEALGRHLGYLPQDVELFAGTVRDNICRFRDDASDAAVIEAARMAHAHDMILALPQGYDTQVGSFATYLSAGQRQRIGLARALFGDPALVVLDEPNANLDRLGDEALASALAGMKARGQAVILVSHRVQAISIADTLLYLDRGMQRAFGPRSEVMKLFQGSQPGSGGDGEPRGGGRGPKPAS